MVHNTLIELRNLRNAPPEYVPVQAVQAEFAEAAATGHGLRRRIQELVLNF